MIKQYLNASVRKLVLPTKIFLSVSLADWLIKFFTINTNGTFKTFLGLEISKVNDFDGFFLSTAISKEYIINYCIFTVLFIVAVHLLKGEVAVNNIWQKIKKVDLPTSIFLALLAIDWISTLFTIDSDGVYSSLLGMQIKRISQGDDFTLNTIFTSEIFINYALFVGFILITTTLLTKKRGINGSSSRSSI